MSGTELAAFPKIIKSLVAIRTPIALSAFVIAAVLYVIAKISAPGESWAILLAACTAVPLLIVALLLSPSVLNVIGKTAAPRLILILMLAAMALMAFYVWVLANRPSEKLVVQNQVSLIINEFRDDKVSIEKCERAWILLESIWETNVPLPDNFYKAAVEVAASGERLAPEAEREKWNNRLMIAATLSGQRPLMAGIELTISEARKMAMEVAVPEIVEAPNVIDVSKSLDVVSKTTKFAQEPINDLGMFIFPAVVTFKIRRGVANDVEIERAIGSTGSEPQYNYFASVALIKVINGQVGAFDSAGALHKLEGEVENKFPGERDDYIFNINPDSSWLNLDAKLALITQQARLELSWCNSGLSHRCNTDPNHRFKTIVNLIADDCADCTSKS